MREKEDRSSLKPGEDYLEFIKEPETKKGQVHDRLAITESQDVYKTLETEE